MKYAIEVQHWGYTEVLHVEEESKYLALAHARELRKGCKCTLKEPKNESLRSGESDNEG